MSYCGHVGFYIESNIQRLGGVFFSGDTMLSVVVVNFLKEMVLSCMKLFQMSF